MNYGRRPDAEGASGIGSWVNIMEFLAILSIPTNIAAIYFSGGSGYNKTSDSPVTIYLADKSGDYWNRGNIILLIVAVEHALIVMKLLLAGLIPDVPKKVLVAESKRPKLI